MRTSTLNINGKQYLACLSTRVMVTLEERGGDAQKELSRILTEAKTRDLFWLLAQCIDAGDRYAKLEGLDNPGTLDPDSLMDLIGPAEYPAVFGALSAAASMGTTPTVEAVPGKNEEATQGDE